METIYVSRLKIDIPSKTRPGHIHVAGTEIAPVGRTSTPHRWEIEIRTCDEKGYWYEILEIGLGDSEVVEVLRDEWED